MNCADDLMRQLLAAAFMCGDIVPFLSKGDPVDVFCDEQGSYALLHEAQYLGYLTQIRERDGTAIGFKITQKGKDFFYGDDPLLLTQESQERTVIDSREKGDTC